MERMLRMIQLLASNVEYSIDDLMERLDMSRRTVYRYLDTFKEAGFAVQKVNPSGNVYRLATLRKPFADLSKVVYFSDEEAYIVNALMDQLGRAPAHVKLRLDYVAKNLLVEEFPMAEKGLTPDGDHWIWEGDVRGMDGVGRFVLGLPMFIEVLEGDGLKVFLREHARYILNEMGL